MGKLILLAALIAVATSKPQQFRPQQGEPQQELYQPPSQYQQPPQQAYQQGPNSAPQKWQAPQQPYPQQPPPQQWQPQQQYAPQPQPQQWHQPNPPNQQQQQWQQQPDSQHNQVSGPFQQQQPKQDQYDHRQSRAQSDNSNSMPRPWYYAASPAGGVGCKVDPSNSRADGGRAIDHQTTGNQNQQQQSPQNAWKDQSPPPQDYYNVVIPSSELANYIQTGQNPQNQKPNSASKTRMPMTQRRPENLDAVDSQKPTAMYPSTPPSLKFKIGLVSDLGKDSPIEDKKKFKSYFKIGHLLLQQAGADSEGNATVEFADDEVHQLETGINTSGEGFELSTLNYFNGKLYACDDETGIVYELIEDEEDKNYKAHPWVLLPNAEEGFKCEWATVKDDHLVVGSTGVLFPGKKPRGNDTNTEDKDKADDEPEEEIHDDDHAGDDSRNKSGETTEEPKEANPNNPNGRFRPRRQSKKTDDSDNDSTEFDKTRQNIKKITQDGRVIHADWSGNYRMIAESLGVNEKKGFVVHEAAAWSNVNQKWLFAPRRLSKDKYDRSTYDKTGTNAAVWTDNEFSELEPVKFGEQVETQGVTDIKFIPGTDDKLILVLKSGLADGKLSSSLSVYDWEGKAMMEDVVVAEGVFAGVEFL